MAPEMQTALVGLAGTILGVAITVILHVSGTIRDGNERFRRDRKIHEKYSDPLAASALALMWRLQELVEDGRDHYLQSHENRTSFESYKATSTLYRLAALLAWIRALRREVFFLRADRAHPRKKQRALDTAIDGLVKALSDGEHMEVLRIASTAERLGLQIDQDSLRCIGAKLDYELDRLVHKHGKQRISELVEHDQRVAVEHAVSLVGGHQALESLADEWRGFLPFLDAREAWIYRDWQAAIGDLLLRDAPAGSRAYDVIGYREFEQLCEEGTEEQQRWLGRLNSVLEDLDMKVPPSQDARIDVLRSVHRACGAIVVAINSLEGRGSPIDSNELKAAMRAAADQPR